MSDSIFKVALFDLDGVVFDTEPQYTLFWGAECRRYHPEIPGLEFKIKGQTLTEILGNVFSREKCEWDGIVERLYRYESQMTYDYVAGFEAFIADIRRNGLKTAVVTSSNKEKMSYVMRTRPELTDIFDKIFTSEDFEKSKPDPDCYIKGAQYFNADTSQCLVFEDSFNGLKSGMASGATVVGLSTSNAPELIKNLSHIVIPHYKGITFDNLKDKILQK